MTMMDHILAMVALFLAGYLAGWHMRDKEAQRPTPPPRGSASAGIGSPSVWLRC